MTIISVIAVALGPHQSVRIIVLYCLLDIPVLVRIPVPLRITSRIRSYNSIDFSFLSPSDYITL